MSSLRVSIAVVIAAAAATAAAIISPQCYKAELVSFDSSPVLSAVDGSSDFSLVFNPSWIVPSAGTNGKRGLLVRTQNCSLKVGGGCHTCGGSGGKASVLTFAQLLDDDSNSSSTPRFKHVDASSVVFAPHDDTDDFGTEDPRVAYDSTTGTYYMLYTCFNSGHAKPLPAVTMCLATSADPTDPKKWTRHGSLGFGDGSKSGALLVREQGPHYLYWGAGQIHITTSNNLTSWPNAGTTFITDTMWGNPNVEAGPPPMRLSTGDFLFFHNSWSADFPAKPPGYQPAWVVLNGSNLTQIIARAPEPLFSPSREPWMSGQPPYTCNTRNVAFLEAAHPAGATDTFRVYFGGSDAVVGSAVVRVQPTGSKCMVV